MKISFKFLPLSIFILLHLIFPGLSAKDNPNLKDLSVSLVGNAHIDLAYRWRWNETVDHVLYDTFDGVLKLMVKEPRLTFAQSQTALYEQAKLNYPDLFKTIRDRIHSGNWAVVGGQWSEMDETMPGGESMIRQFLLSNEFFEKYMNIANPEIMWAPDAFTGHAATLPQIYAGCGIKYYVFTRNPPPDKRIFWWQGPDGSKILAYAIPGHYNLKIGGALLKAVRDWYQITGYRDVMVLYGEGDHGGGPRQPDLTAIENLCKEPGMPRFVFDTPGKYFSRLLKSKKNWPAHRGEIGVTVVRDGKKMETWHGCYTSQARIKKANRDAENLLLTAEEFTTIGAGLQGKPFFPRVDLREVWKILLKNQFHDILPGTSTSLAADDALKDYALLKEKTMQLLNFGLESIGARIDTRGKGIPLVVYNPASVNQTGQVETSIRFVSPRKFFQIIDTNGETIPFVIMDWSRGGESAHVLLNVKDVPAVGYKVLRVVEGSAQLPESDLKYFNHSAENKFYKLSWNKTGLSQIFDKRLNRELLRGQGNVLKLLEEIHGSSWTLQLTGKKVPLLRVAGPQIVEKNDLRTVVQWKDRSESSIFTRQVILKAGSPGIEFNLSVDWHDSDKLLRVEFPLNLADGKTFYEQPYGSIERENDGIEYPAQKWVDVFNEKFGVALLNNGKYGFSVENSVLKMSVVRGPRDMDPRMDEGVHSFQYALFSHKGDWREGNVVLEGVKFNQPLLARQENKHSGKVSGWTSNVHLPVEKSFYAANSNHVLITAIKVQQGDWAPNNTILRLYETEGREDLVTVSLPAKPKIVTETNHLEKPLEQQPDLTFNAAGFTFQITPHQIRTFKVVY